ncbi:Mechanosensitive ion channel [Halobacillus karajensis]|uniref:MscS family protein YfkC n=1 Tax=Halobacillus karajensis TaxID=195088 RepID=A0A024P4V3_9BACI|nr:mechanosensitive ion channel family protein [Halobacillus karajensis]CDQ20457.1 putative MscS family protein YfkC [Halobacillus karajensis]CDQ24074.1 putative MscS family protein YfkC [Halobacillus karajensis]CDQ27552.1 putative MscS family protein YfkC [Halobacillus karajensis]SEH91398.1 Mechanosensitive ion channel [Halobacillus karajensis]
MSLTEFETYLDDHAIIKLLVTAALLFVIVLILRKVIHTFFQKTDFIEEKKEKTLESMLNSIISYAAVIGFILVVLDQFTSIEKLLAGAGVIGIIVGFGAQSLIKDFFAGLFLLYEKQLHKGDFITVNNTFHGTVEDIGLRFLKVRQWSGKLLTISNGQIKTIENYNFDYMRVIEKVTTSFQQEPKQASQILEKACERLNDELYQYLKKDLTDKPYEPFQVYGMSSLNHEHRGYEYTIVGVVEDLVYWTAAKKTRFILAEELFEHNIFMSEQRVELNSSFKEKPYFNSNEKLT